MLSLFLHWRLTCSGLILKQWILPLLPHITPRQAVPVSTWVLVLATFVVPVSFLFLPRSFQHISLTIDRLGTHAASIQSVSKTTAGATEGTPINYASTTRIIHEHRFRWIWFACVHHPADFFTSATEYCPIVPSHQPEPTRKNCSWGECGQVSWQCSFWWKCVCYVFSVDIWVRGGAKSARATVRNSKPTHILSLSPIYFYKEQPTRVIVYQMILVLLCCHHVDFEYNSFVDAFNTL